MSVAFDWLSTITVVGAGAVTLMARASFIVLPAGTRVPEWFSRALKYVAAAVLPALIVPDVLFRELSGGQLVNTHRLLAALIAAWVAYRTRSIFATLGAGMASLWILTWALPWLHAALLGAR
jgi:branched-subunit amino acid transport protein